MSNKRLYVESLGAGKDLTLIHGWGSHGGIWSDAARQLGREFRVHVVDLPGYGRSASTSVSDLGDLVDAVSRSAAALTHVCGWSLGATVALAWARKRPEQIDRLSLVAATPCFVTRPDWRRGLAPEVLRSFAAELRQDARAGLTRFASLQAAESRATLAQLRAHLFERGEPSLPVLDYGLQLLAQIDLREHIAEVPNPTLVLHGVSDRLVPLAAGRWLSEHLPQAKLQLFHGCGHAPFLSKPSRFAQAIRDFLHDD